MDRALGPGPVLDWAHGERPWPHSLGTLLAGAMFNVCACLLARHLSCNPTLDLQTHARFADPCKYDTRAGPGPVLDWDQGPGPGPLFIKLVVGAVFDVGCMSSFRALVL